MCQAVATAGGALLLKADGAAVLSDSAGCAGDLPLADDGTGVLFDSMVGGLGVAAGCALMSCGGLIRQTPAASRSVLLVTLGVIPCIA